MTLETIAYYGCTQSGELDLWNCDRTLTYARRFGPTIDRACCPDFSSLLEFAQVPPRGPNPITLSADQTPINVGAIVTDSVFTGAYTVAAGSNRRLLVFIAVGAAVSTPIDVVPIAVTLNGVPLTEVIQVNIFESMYATSAIWYLNEADIPAIGSHTLSVTLSNPGAAIGGITARCFMAANVDTTSPPIPAEFATTVTQATYAISVPALTTGAVFAAIMAVGTPASGLTAFAAVSPTVELADGATPVTILFRSAVAWIPSPVDGTNVLSMTSTGNGTSQTIAACYMDRARLTSVYNDPATDEAWWYDAARPESAGFFGLEVFRVSGLYASTTTREITTRLTDCGGRGLYGPQVDRGYTITVEGALHGATCCAVRYGYLALKSLLRGCCSSKMCTGTRMRILTSIPDMTSHGCDDLLPAETTNPWRTLTNVAMIDEPEIVGRSGPSCGCGCAPHTTVQFVLHADPGQYLDAVAVQAASLILSGADMCELSLPSCTTTGSLLIDPLCSTPIVPRPPDAGSTCFCRPIVIARKTFTTTVPASMFSSQLEVEIKAGSSALRNLTVKIWRALPWAPAFDADVYNDDNMCGGFSISYIPAKATWRRTACDGVTVLFSGGTIERGDSTLLTVEGLSGSPCVTLPCGDVIISVEADTLNTSASASISMSRREVEP